MNKQLHRVIFSRTKGQVIVVAEIAATRRKGTTGKSGKRRTALGFAMRPLRLAVLSILGMTATPLLANGIVADSTAPTNQQADILSSANGTPLINIQKPSQAGVSRNVYSQFDVHAQGAILNNATSNVQTQIGGWIEGNAKLQGKHARIILNEVNASDPSLLNGYIEVAGKRAEVVIANPAGIQVNGGGFINASRATLTTGTPQLAGGELLGYTIEQGTIHIGGTGLDASQTDYTAILARAVEVNAGIWADELNIVTGANQINIDHSQVTPLDADTPDFSFALDVAHLGGMYAGKITLIGTEHGMGVRNAGEIAAMQGKLVLDASGMLINTGEIASSQQASLRVAALDNSGLIDGTQTLIDADIVDNHGGRIYGNHLAIQADTLNNLAADEEPASPAGVIAARERLDIAVGTLNNLDEALILSLDSLHIGGELDEQAYADGQASLIHNNGATIESLGDMQIHAKTMLNTNADFATEMQRVGSPVDREWRSGKYQYRTTRTTRRESATRSLPGEILAGGQLSIHGEELVNDKSHILAGGLLDIEVDSLHNIDATGRQIISEKGQSRYEYKKCLIKDPIFGCVYKEKRWSSWTTYNPADKVTTVNLNIAKLSGDSNHHRDTTLPGNALFQINTHNPNAPLFETDPRFADYRTWLSSDYMMSALELDPTDSLRRLGDGFYEQRLIRQQIIEQTGQRHLVGFDNDEAQFLALMDSGLSQAEDLKLRPGIALSAAQTAQLTSDIVWLVKETVTLPDGSLAQALVPRVYTLPRESELTTAGTLIAGHHLLLDIQDTLHNSGTLAARDTLLAGATDIRNEGGQLQAKHLALRAEQDIHNIGGNLRAADSLVLDAGRDIIMTSTTQSDHKQHGASYYTRTNLDRLASVYVTQADGVLVMQADRDMELTATRIRNDGDAGYTLLSAGQDVRLNTLTTYEQEMTVWGGDKYSNKYNQIAASQDFVVPGIFTSNTYNNMESTLYNRLTQGSSQEVGTRIQSEGDILVLAGQDINARYAQLSSAQGAIDLLAARDILLSSGNATQWKDEFHLHVEQGIRGSESNSRHQTELSTNALASLISAETVSLTSGQDVQLIGSQAVATGEIAIQAQRDVRIEAEYLKNHAAITEENNKDGLFISGPFSITRGKYRETQQQQGQYVTATASTVGSISGNVDILAGDQYVQSGSHLIAPDGNIFVQGKNMTISAAYDSYDNTYDARMNQGGVTLALSSPVITALETMQRMQQAAKKTDDSRMQALAHATTAMSAYDAYSSYQQAPSQGGGITISLTVGSSRSESQTDSRAQQAVASTLAAGGDIALQASGSEQSDIAIIGSQLSAGNKLHLYADNDIHLLAAQNIAAQQSKNSASSSAVGVAASLGSDGWSFGFHASASGSRGHADGLDIQHSNTRLSAGDTLTLSAGNDTTLRGAVAEAERIQARIGGDLHIESLQDTHHYDSKQQSASGSVTIGYGFSGSVNAAQQTVKADYASVTEQSALRAGDGGFDISVGGNTALIGGAITSTQAAIDEGKNHFNTGGELHLSDIKNRADFKAQAFSIGLSGSGGGGNSSSVGGGLGYASDGGSDASTTLAAISGIAGNKDACTGDAESGIERIFDPGKVEREMGAQVAITQAFGQRAPKVWADYATYKQASLINEAMETTDPQQRSALLQEAAQWGEGGSYRTLGHGILGALAGDASGAVGAMSSTLVMAELGQALDDSALPDSVKQGLGLITATTIGALTGDLAGAAMAYNVEANNRQLHPDERELAKRLAEESEGRYSAEAIMEMLRLAYNEPMNESPTDNMVIHFGDDPGSAMEAGYFDGGGNWLTVTDAQGQPVYMVQMLSPDTDPALQQYITASTGGDESPYHWGPKLNISPVESMDGMAWTSQGWVSINDGDASKLQQVLVSAGNQHYPLQGYFLNDIASTPLSLSSILSNPTAHGLHAVPTESGTLYISTQMGGQNQAYLDKVKETTFANLGDAATTATVACPACAPVTVPIGFISKSGEVVYSDNPYRTITTSIAGTISGGTGRFIANDIGVTSLHGLRRANEIGRYAGETWFTENWNAIQSVTKTKP